LNDRLLALLRRSIVGRQILDMGCDELDLDVLIPWDARRLQRRLAKVETIGEALMLHLPGRDAGSLATCVRALIAQLDVSGVEEEEEAQAAEPQPERGHPFVDVGDLAPGMDKGSLEQWAREHDVTDLLASHVSHVVDADVLYRLHVWSTDRSVADMICATPMVFGRWSDPAPELQQEVIRALVAHATSTRTWMARETDAESWRAQPPDHPTVRDLYDVVLAERESARSHVPPRGWNTAVELTFEADPVAIVARIPRIGSAEIKISVEPIPKAIRPLPQPGLRLGVADRVLDLLTSPDDASLRAELVRILTVPRWQRDIDALSQSVARPRTSPDEDKNLLCWRVVDLEGRPRFEAVRAAWSRKGSLKTRSASLSEITDLLVDPVDQRIAELVAAGDGGRLEAFDAAVGHPRILEPGRGGTAVPVRRGRLVLAVRHEGDDATVQLVLDEVPLSPAELDLALRHNTGGGRIVVRRPDAIVVASASRVELARLAPWLRRDTRLPPPAHDALLDVVAGLSSRLAVEVAPTLRGAQLEGDPRPVLLLAWEEPSALTVTARVRPAPELPPSVPGEGSPTWFVRRGDRRLCIERDLDGEITQVRDALAPLHLSDRHAQGAFAWGLTERTDTLSVVERLQDHLSSFQVEWTGTVPRVRAAITAKSLKLTVRQDRDWFGISGGVSLTSGAVDVELLLRTIDEGHDYVQVAEGTFARLDQALKAQLAVLGDTAISPVLAPAMAALEEAGATIDAPAAWTDLAGRVEEARDLEAPLPSGLRAELRDYQVTGFRWLASLAHWAPGACLADDMGLGKTVQTLALLLRRADLGPALVVAPASVLLNWEREAERFAPDLLVHVHHGAARELPSLGPSTVLLTTYGVLVRDAELLSAIRFATAVLDEAQAIKNPAARRSVAACELQADFRLLLSGTPVENRVAELWSLFRFAAPGLLRSESVFRDRFVDPIESRHDLGRRGVLAATIRPFLLRRTKEQVERELPPLTESVLYVDLSVEERTLYEAARVRAVARMERAPSHERRFRVLQELLTLRQIACHPRLADPGSPVPSSKLATLLHLLSDLRQGGHRALLFSQFVKHLALVREALDRDGFRYRYLDGSMAPSARRAEVDAFQSGSADLFLISREAGGVGLNLTAADYVVHLDPWWNPAKEDQATDRAHRIGQDKPVTVYRLVAQATIEERILDLHAQKRELADALLAGTDLGERVSTAELLALLGGDPSGGAPASGAAPSPGTPPGRAPGPSEPAWVESSRT